MSASVTAGEVAEFMHRGAAIRFFVANPDDIIQSRHVCGEFYEREELALIERYFPAGGAYLDVGANVGNHLIYIAKFCAPADLIAVEPNPAALKLLEINLALNRVTATVIALGLSDGPGRAVVRWPANNLGAARTFAEPQGGVRLIAGDELFSERKIDFIKIDVETQELAVLTGLAKTIAANRPPIFVEVDDVNRAAVEVWASDNRYHVAETIRRYASNENLMLTPL